MGAGHGRVHEGQEVGQPEGVVLLDVDGDEGRQGANVDDPVEPHEEPLNRQLRVDDDLLARLERPEHGLRAVVLLGAHGRHVGLDAAGGEADGDHGGDEAAKAGPMRERRGGRRGDEDDEADDVDAASADDGLVLAEVLVWS